MSKGTQANIVIYLETFGFWKYFEIYGNIYKYLEIYGSIQKYWEIFGNLGKEKREETLGGSTRRILDSGASLASRKTEHHCCSLMD